MTTKNPPTAEVPAVITVDLQISKVVLDAVKARLPLVQKLEREQHGKAWTNLSSLAEQILRDWRPGVTRIPKPLPRETCPHCGRDYALYANGKMRVHGPPGRQCPEYIARPRRRTKTQPLRFPMNRQEYEGIKELIRSHGQSVAHVITQRLAHFAREGHL